jgi:hypothetical protein
MIAYKNRFFQMTGKVLSFLLLATMSAKASVPKTASFESKKTISHGVVETIQSDTTPAKKKSRYVSNFYGLGLGVQHKRDNQVFERGTHFSIQGHVPMIIAKRGGFVYDNFSIVAGFNLRNRGVGFSSQARFVDYSSGNAVAVANNSYYENSEVFIGARFEPKIDLLRSLKKTTEIGDKTFTSAMIVTGFGGIGGRNNVAFSGGDNVDMQRLTPYYEFGVGVYIGGLTQTKNDGKKSKEKFFRGIGVEIGMTKNLYKGRTRFQFPENSPYAGLYGVANEPEWNPTIKAYIVF